MEDLPIGSEIVLKVVESEKEECNGCDDCFFGYDDTCYNPTYNGWGDGFLCEREERSDGKHVIFKEVKE